MLYSVRKLPVLLLAGVVLTAGCGTAQPVHSRIQPLTRRSSSSSGYPGERADEALCKTYNADIQSGDTYDISQALQEALGTVSPKLAQDLQAVVNGTTMSQDLKAQVHVTLDCALVKEGIPPRS